MRKRKFMQLCAIVMSGAMLLAGCGGKADEPASQDTGSSGQQAAPATPTESDGKAEVSQPSGEEVTISFTHWGGDDTYTDVYWR